MSKNGDHVLGKEDNKSIWFKGGVVHNDQKEWSQKWQQWITLPAIIGDDGSKLWMQNGVRHRDQMVYNMESGEVNELQACIFSCGTIIWCRGGDIGRTMYWLPCIIIHSKPYYKVADCDMFDECSICGW